MPSIQDAFLTGIKKLKDSNITDEIRIGAILRDQKINTPSTK